MAKKRTGRPALQRAITQSSAPIYLVSRDLRILFVNDAVVQWTGLDADALVGMECVYRTAPDETPSTRTAFGLCPPPDAFETPGSPFTVWAISPAGRPEYRLATSTPIPGDDGVVLMIAVHGAADTEGDGVTPEETPRALHKQIATQQFALATSLDKTFLVGHSSAAERVRRQIAVAGETGVNTVVVGPVGSGRRRIADLIHFARTPALAGPLIPFDCRIGDPVTLQDVVKDLFRQHRRYPDEPLGRLLLDNIEQLPHAAGDELCGFFELPQFHLPVIALTTEAGLETLDSRLHHHLATLTVTLAPLATRREDIPLVAQAILEQCNAAGSEQFSGFTEEALRYLIEYAWPGELEEVITVIEQAIGSATPPQVKAADIPSNVRLALRDAVMGPASVPEAIDLDALLADVELELITRSLGVAEGNKSQAARLLGISRARLLRRLEGVEGTGAAASLVRDASEEDNTEEGNAVDARHAAGKRHSANRSQELGE